jgi:hypothetical protein
MQRLRSIGLAGAMALCAFAVPSKASVFLAFSATAPGGGTYTMPSGTSNGTFSLATASILFTTLIVSNDTFPGTNGTYTLTGTGSGNCTNASGATLSLSGSTMTLWGAITGMAGLSSGCNSLVTFTDSNSGGFTGITTNGGTSSTVSLNNATSISESATLLTDLHVASNTSPGALGGGAGWSSGSGGNGSFTANSEQFTLALVQTPEPVSFLLVGTGLLAMICIAKKKSAAAQS